MENSVAKALIITAGVLLAMIVIAFVTFSFRRLSEWAEAKDSEKLIAQVEKFNKEYEIYEKQLMYGVDVISCLNKAKSNNDKIAGKYAEALDNAYEVQVSLKLKSKLQESIVVYNTEKGEKESETSSWNSGYTLDTMDPKFSFIKNSIAGSSFKKTDVLQTTYKDSNMVAGTYELTYKENGMNESILREQLNLLSVASSETVKNKTTISKSADKKIWTRAVYKPTLYDMKTKKFKCTGIEYDANTSRVKKISFEEI